MTFWLSTKDRMIEHLQVENSWLREQNTRLISTIAELERPGTAAAVKRSLREDKPGQVSVEEKPEPKPEPEDDTPPGFG